MTKVSKKLQDKLEVLKDNKYAIKLWKLYKKYYRKNYTSPDEEKERLGKFIDNLGNLSGKYVKNEYYNDGEAPEKSVDVEITNNAGNLIPVGAQD